MDTHIEYSHSTVCYCGLSTWPRLWLSPCHTARKVPYAPSFHHSDPSYVSQKVFVAFTKHNDQFLSHIYESCSCMQCADPLICATFQ